MSVRLKTILLVGVLVLSLLTLIYFMIRPVFLRGFTDLETEQAEQAVFQVQNTILREQTTLLDRVYEWACWDDSCQFMRDTNAHYIRRNLTILTFVESHLDTMVFLTPSGKFHYGVTYNSVRRQSEYTISPALRHYIATHRALFSFSTPRMNRAGIIMLPEGPMLVAIRPIVPSTGRGHIYGTLFIGRYLDQEQINSWQTLTQHTLAFFPYAEEALPTDVRAARKNLLRKASRFLQVRAHDSISGYALLRDLTGQPSLILRVDTQRALFAQGERCLGLFIILLLVAGVAAVVILSFTLDYLVIRRVLRLHRRLAEIGKDGDPTGRVLPDGHHDELSDLGEAVNGMLAALAYSHQTLRRKESALRASERQYRTLVEELPVITYSNSLDPEHPGSYISPQVETLLGYTPQEWCEDPAIFYGGIHPEDVESVMEELSHSINAGLPCMMEYRFQTRDGQWLWLHDEAHVLTDDAGEQASIQGVMVDITEKKQRADYARQLQQLQEAAKLKSEFLSHISHELKTPLTPVLGVLGLFKDQVLDPSGPQYAEAVEMALRQANRLLRLIDDMLLLSRLENGGLPIERTVVDFATIIRQSVEARRPLFVEQGITLCLELDPAVPPICGDQLRLEQALDNLLDNALKYTPSGSVTLHLSGEDRMARLDITDTGVGLDTEMTTRIFDEFYQVDAYQKGAGLGLAIVQGIIVAHEGYLTVTSPGLGCGCTFTLLLPLAVPPCLAVENGIATPGGAR
ncbi:MAG TPA: CHASE4 domain-containing protein [Armatimonadota bacterium]|jgi:hypothetical protein